MFLYPEGCTPIYKGGIVSKPAPGMQNAMVILTARVQNMEGNYSADEYIELLRCEAESQDPMILISAIGVVVTPVSILAITAIYALEVLVAFIQAYVFTILACVYLKDALHPGH